MMIIEILGDPIALKRHRSFMRGNKIGHCDPQVKEKNIFRKKLFEEVEKMGIKDLLIGKTQYNVQICFGMPFAKSLRRKVMPEISSIPHTKYPDIDNLIKFVLDCGNEILWKDDRLITRICGKKIYLEEPKTIIYIH